MRAGDLRTSLGGAVIGRTTITGFFTSKKMWEITKKLVLFGQISLMLDCFSEDDLFFSA